MQSGFQMDNSVVRSHYRPFRDFDRKCSSSLVIIAGNEIIFYKVGQHVSGHFEPKNKFVSIKLRALEARTAEQDRLSGPNSGQIALVSSSLSTRSQFDKAMCVCVQSF